MFGGNWTSLYSSYELFCWKRCSVDCVRHWASCFGQLDHGCRVRWSQCLYGQLSSCSRGHDKNVKLAKKKVKIWILSCMLFTPLFALCRKKYTAQMNFGGPCYLSCFYITWRRRALNDFIWRWSLRADDLYSFLPLNNTHSLNHNRLIDFALFHPPPSPLGLILIYPVIYLRCDEE